MAGVGGKINIKVNLQEIERLKKEIKEVKEQILNLSGSDVQKYLDGLNQKYQDLNKQLQVAGEEAMNMAREIDSLNEKYNQQKSTIEQYENQIISLTDQLKNSAKGVNSPEYQELEKDLQKVESAYEKVTQEAENTKQAVSQKMGVTGNVDKFFDGIEKNADNFVDAINRQREAIKKMELDYINTREKMSELGKRKNYSPENMAEYEKLKKLMVEIRSDISLEKKDLSALEKAYKQFMDSRTEATETYLVQMRKLREEMAQLVNADGSVSPQNLQRYEELKTKLSEVGTAYRRVQAEQKLLTSTGSAQLAGVIQGITGLSGAFAAGQGVVSLFVKDNEKLAAIQTKLQAAMAITIGLQQVSNTLRATSAFRTQTVTKATQLLASANTWLTTTLGISNVAAKALMATLTLGLSVAITGVIYLINKYTSDQEKAAATTKKFNESVASSVASQTMEYEKLRKQWVAAKDDLKQKEKLVRENIDAYNTFGVKINDVKDAENLFVKNAEAFRDSMMLRAKSVAAMELATEKYKEYLTAMADAEKRTTDRSFTQAMSDGAESLLNRFESFVQTISSGKYVQNLGEDYFAKQASNRDKSDAERLNKESQEWFEKAFGYDEESRKKLKESGGKLTDEIAEGSKTHWQSIRDQQQKIMDANLPDSSLFKAAKKQRDEAAKILEQWDKTNFKSQESAAEKARKQAQELSKAKEKQSSQDARAAKDLEFQIIEAEIKAKDEGSAKVLAQMDFNYKKEKEALKRQQEDILKSRKENARAAFEADINNKGKSFDDTAIKLTAEELEKYKKIQEKNDESYQNDKLNLELQYMRDYIKEYGTFQQKKLAIAQEYDKKIAASQNEWDKKSLEAQKKRAMSAVDFDAINKRIDWQGVFGNMTGMLDSQLKETLSGLKEYVKTDQFKASSDTDKKTVYDAIAQLRSVIPGGQGTLDFNTIRRQMDDLGAAINELQAATLNEKTAYENLDKAQKKYDDALKSGSQTLIDSAKQSLDAAKNSAGEASDAYKNAESNVQGLGSSFKETATDTIDGLNSVADGLNSFSSNSLPQIFKGLQNTVTGLSKLNIGGKVSEAVGTLSETLSSAGFIGQIISAVLSILDILKEGVGTLVANLIDTILNAVDGILKNILTGKLFTQISNSLKTGIGNILNTISFGGFNSLMNSINGSNAKETAETISRLTSSNDALRVSVDALKDEIAGANGAKSIQAYNEAVQAQERYNENLRQILDAQMRYHGSHHSNAYYWNLDPNSIKQVNTLLGTSLNNTWSDFSRLTAEQMDDIRKHLPDVWSEMTNQGKYADRFKDDWNNYADQAGKVDELTKEIRENMAQVSFSSLRDSFVNALMDMESDAEDFADDFQEMMMKALLNAKIGNLLDTELSEWYDSWTETMRAQGGKLTPDQIDDYRDEWDRFVQMGIDARDEMAKITGYTGKDSSSTSQQASRGGFETMSQDTASALEGRFTAMQMNLISIDGNVARIAQWNQPVGDKFNFDSMAVPMMSLNESSLRIERMIEENRNIAISSYYELKDINKNTKELYQMNERLGQMNSKLDNL